MKEQKLTNKQTNKQNKIWWRIKKQMKFRPIAPRPVDNTYQEGDNDDCSLGSLGEIN